MKNEKLSLYLSFLSMVIFLFSACICYIKVNRRINDVQNTSSGVAIFNFDHSSSSMDINPIDMFSANEEAIASNAIKLSVFYNNVEAKEYPFQIVMDNYTAYSKSEGVDGINSFEYTYEIKKNNIVVSKEKELDSYEIGSKIILYKENLKGSELAQDYEIIFRFYANEYDQNHLVGTSLSSNLKIEPISID